ncbi:adenosylcobinamide-phosphate synthase CbiB [Akkermansia muciniphila]|uniref:adenosylcobinamide-phosphate synthase CbiB n=1 Tax=Akkermansia muciniphila TaxID=239935 RepID=UPI001BFF02C8|nr:adenosylcobinamide-phosphate synthase CbiB [Akkermansia muciniphila]MBT8778499.1 cobalamin biosynthesis protein CobD [Akkermansia muciniphila]
MLPCPFILPAALLLDILAGDPPNRFHPVCLIGWCARHMEPLARRLWGGTFTAGMAAALGTCAAAWCACAAFLLPFSFFPSPRILWIPAVLVIYICMAPRGLAEHARLVANALRAGNDGAARHAVSMIVGRDTERLDRHGIARAAIESVAENLTDGVFSTLFWATAGFLAGGASGAAFAALTHRVFNILDAMWGKKNDRYRHFGTFAARTDDALNFIPARLILPCISLAALLVKGASARRALTTGWTFRRAHASPNSAWSEAAFAGALGLRIGGPVSYKGIPADYPWIGDGRTEATVSDLALAIRLMWMTALMGTLVFSLLLLFIPRF